MPFFPSPVLLLRRLSSCCIRRAPKCRKWLLANGANLHANNRKFVTLSQMAVAGGKIEIIRLCQQYNLSCYGAKNLVD
jgi:hypothetical protein